MDKILSKAKTNLIHEIANKQGYTKYKVDSKQGSLKGDGYTGEIIFVNISDEINEKVLHLILKSAHDGDLLPDRLSIGQIYDRENFMYSVIFKDYIELQREYNVSPPFNETAHYYGGLTEKHEACIVLENLNDSGFKMWKRRIPMDSNHVGAVMATYGKFHALSHAMKKLKPEQYALRSKNLRSHFEGKMNSAEFEKTLGNVMEGAFKIVEDNAAATAGLKRFIDGSEEFFMKEVPRVDEKYSVILHGDCWCNNMMFKYEDMEPNKPSEVYLLDWQLACIGSPLLDLTYFFYSCSSKVCLDSYETYLKIYYDSLSEMLERFEIPVTEVLTFEELKLQWRKFAKHGMYMSILIIRIMLTEQEEVRDIRDIGENGNVMDLFNGDVRISNTEEYERRVRIVIDHMIENGFI